MEIVLITIVTLAVIMALAFYIIKARDKIANGDLKFIEILNNKAVIISTITHSGGESDSFDHTKLTVYDLNMPQERKMKIFKHEIKEVYQTEKYLVMEFGRGYFSVFDTNTFEECYDTRQPQKFIKLDSEDGIAEIKYLKVDQKFDITTRQGKKMFLYLKDFLQIKSPESQTEKRKYPIGNFNLYKHKENETFVLHYNHQPIPESKEYINAQVVSGDPNIAVIIHDSAIMDYPEIKISGVNSNGQEIWMHTGAQLKLKHDTEYASRIKLFEWRDEGDVVLLAFNAKTDRVAAIKKQSGELLFLY